MAKAYVENQKMQGIDYTSSPLPLCEYDNCTFSNCIFTNGNLSGQVFSDCIFDDCDLSMTKWADTEIRNAQFRNCKMLGINFYECKHFLLSFSFEACLLHFSSFYKLAIKNTTFKDCNLESVEFAEADLSHSIWRNCNLSGAVFERTKLDHADLRTATHFSIDPEINSLTKAKFSNQNLAGLLGKHKIIIEHP